MIRKFKVGDKVKLINPPTGTTNWPYWTSYKKGFLGQIGEIVNPLIPPYSQRGIEAYHVRMPDHGLIRARVEWLEPVLTDTPQTEETTPKGSLLFDHPYDDFVGKKRDEIFRQML